MPKEKQHSLNIRLSENCYKQLDSLCKRHGKNKTCMIRGLIDGADYRSREEVTANSVELMRAIADLNGYCDSELYGNVKKAGEELCRSLLIK
jgi:hypothetical protein